MINRRTWLRTIGWLALLSLLGGYGYLSWLRLLERQHIRQVDWQGPSLRLDGIHLAHLNLLRQNAEGSLRIEAADLQLSWRPLDWTAPFLQDMRLGELSLDWRPAANPPVAPPASVSTNLQMLASGLSLLPQSLRIDQLKADLPCPAGRCAVNANLQLLRHPDLVPALDMRLELLGEASRLNWEGALRETPESLDIQLTLAIDDQPQLQLASNLASGADGTRWRGELNASRLSEAEALYDWLSQWLPSPVTPLTSAPKDAHLMASWQLQLAPGDLNWEWLAGVDGHVEASAQFPEPWPIPGAGLVQGRLAVSARAISGQWFAERLESDLRLQQIAPDWLDVLPRPLQADSLRLRIQPSEPPPDLPANLVGRSLPLAIDVQGDGPTRFDLHAILTPANSPPWAAQLTNAKLTAANPRLTLNGWTGRKLKAALQLSGYLDSQQLLLDLGEDSTLELGELDTGELRLKGVTSQLQGLQLRAQHQGGFPRTWDLTSPVSLTVQRVVQAGLRPQGWRWQGRLTANQEHQELEGQLSADAGLPLHIRASHDLINGLQLQARMTELFLRAGNPLAKTLSDWPTLLDLNDGRLSALASLTLAPRQATPTLRIELTGKGLAGIFDRTALSGLDGRAQINLTAQQLQVELSELHLEQANPGIPIGPLSLRGQYRTSLTQPNRGTLDLQQAEATVLGGVLQLPPGSWDLAQSDPVFPLQLNGMQLEQLLTLYPAEGLAGSGTLDGQLPLHFGVAGIEIRQGQVSARAPGGHLQFRSERFRALGRSNPTMQLVTQSLEDFRFTTLDSQLTYEPQGTLHLAMRLEGRNPATEQGRPIHFNINLEEDIPSLLASLQLTDKVSELIKQRVQQRLLQRNAEAPQEP